MGARNLYSCLEELPDSRRDEGKRHPQSLVLSIVILATLSGYFGFRAIGDFIQKHQEALLTVFKPKKNRLPSYSTVRRVLVGLDFNQLSRMFQQWTSEQAAGVPQDWLPVDGKVLGGTVSEVHSERQSYTNLISVFSQQTQQVLATAEVRGDKESEIPVVQRLLRQWSSQGVVFTFDALHCQKETTRLIVEKQCDYVIAVKKNQKTLSHQITQNMEHSLPVDRHQTEELNRGRRERRTVEVYDDLTGIDHQWKGLNTLLKVRRLTRSKQRDEDHNFLYISSLPPQLGAPAFAKGIRGHWGIENSLHYVKDKVFKEDDSTIRTGEAPKNMSVIRNIVMNLIRRAGYLSIIQAIRLIANDMNLISKMVLE